MYPRNQHRRTPYPTYNYSYQPQTARTVGRKKHSRPIMLIATGLPVLSIAAVVGHIIFSSPTQADSTNAVTTSQKQEVKAASVVPIDPTAMQQQISSIITANPDDDTAVAVQDVTTGQAFHYGTTAPFVAASTAKLITASLYLHEIEQGKLSLNTMIAGKTAATQLQLMIVQSDNDAWSGFNDLLTHSALLAYATEIGITNYNPDKNTMSPDAIATLLAKLYQGKLLNSDHKKLLLSYMQNANETQYILAAVPDETKVYHKAGWLDDRIHDAAIIDNGKRAFVLVIFSKAKSGSYDTTAGQDMFHKITTSAIQAFQAN